MSKKLSNSIKNVFLGNQNFSEVLGYYSKIRNCFSQLAVHKPITNKPDTSYYNQDFGEKGLSNRVNYVFPNGLNPTSLKWMSSDVFSLHNKCLDKGQTRPICTPGLPWQPSYRFYYERKSPQCPPTRPKARADCKTDPCPPVSCPPKKDACPPRKKSACGPKPKKSSCVKKNPCAKKNPCSKCTAYTMRNICITQCRLCSCGGGKKESSCAPIKKKCAGRSSGSTKGACGGGGGRKKSKCAAISKKCGGGGDKKSDDPCGPKKCG